MSHPFVGEIRMVGFNFAPQGWALCNGALIAIADNEILFDLIGTTYGGDGIQTYALPNMQSRRLVHPGNNGVSNYVQGQIGGVESVTLTANQTPSHNHLPVASSHPGTTTSPQGAYWAAGTGSTRPYTPSVQGAPMLGGIVSTVGGNQPHDNLQPYLTINFVISLFGIFPSQS